ncbi:IclR family transcriptional regulator [Nocardioides sp. LHD-245]|uniref:IclR family transcriptional regulator n=1 Tax=Nocardioides sp. LHD-245 TaxID=3051387 RepID=UPI0027E1688C|nr:IclR family transcriptional regulator [Nocardioides sp. LHD-245]
MAAIATQRRSTARVLRVLMFLATKAEPVPAAALVAECDIPKQTLYPMLRDMAEAGFVVYFPEERRWGLGVSAFEIGSAYLRSDPLQRLGGPVLDLMARRLKVTSHLATLHGNEALYIVKHVPDTHAHHLITEVGVRLPAHLTAVGRAMLSSLPAHQVRALYPSDDAFVRRTDHAIASLSQLRAVLRTDRARGYSVESDFTSAGITCIASAIHDRDGRPVAAAGISFETACHDPESWPDLAIRVQKAAAAVTARIHGRRHVGSHI